MEIATLEEFITWTLPMMFMASAADELNWVTVSNMAESSYGIEAKFMVYSNSELLSSYLDSDLWSTDYYTQKKAE